MDNRYENKHSATTEKKRIPNLLTSLIINAVILAAYLVMTHMSYETNDDYAIASRIVDGCAEVNFVNYYLCRILGPLQQSAGSINVYVIAQLLFSFIAFTVMLKLIMDRTDSRLTRIAAAFVIAVFAADHYCSIQFTKTAALLIITASIVVVDNMVNKGSVLKYILGLILLYAGVAFRVDGLIAAIGFAGLYLLDRIIIYRRSLKDDGYLSAGKIITCVIVLLAVFGSYGFDHMSFRANTATDELKAYKDYSNLRSAIVDYPVYDRFDLNYEAYQKAGISENDLYLIDHWYFDYNGAASTENLTAIIEADASGEKETYTMKQAVEDCIKSTMKSVRKTDSTGIHIILLGVIFIWALFALRPRSWIWLILTAGLAAALYTAIYYMQRPAYRALYIADIGAAFWMLYAISAGDDRPDDKARGHNRRAPAAVIAVCVIIASAALALPLYRCCGSAYKAASKKPMPAELAEYFEEHSDSFYVWGTSEKKSGANYVKPWLAPDTEAEKNVIGTGSWGTMSPYVLGKMSAYGIYDPVSDIIDNENAYYVGNKKIKRLREYYNKWYGGNGTEIIMEKTGTVGGYDIWRVFAKKDTN